MRVKKIGIKSVRQGMKEFAETVRKIQRGKPPKKKKAGVFFVSLSAMRRVLTPRRIELLRIIRKRRPRSIYDLARVSRRDLKNVQDDVAMLARIGLVSLAKKKAARRPVIPRVDYDNLQLQIPVI